MTLARAQKVARHASRDGESRYVLYDDSTGTRHPWHVARDADLYQFYAGCKPHYVYAGGREDV